MSIIFAIVFDPERLDMSSSTCLRPKGSLASAELGAGST